jgi:hypothetical protein
MEESNLTAKKRTRTKALASCVYFDEDEYKHISADARATGKSIPMLLKTAYFPNRRVRVLMHKDDEQKWFSELRRWGVNLNQIARQVNSGFMAGWYEEFKFVSAALLNIEKLVVGAYGSSHV